MHAAKWPMNKEIFINTALASLLPLEGCVTVSAIRTPFSFGGITLAAEELSQDRDLWSPQCGHSDVVLLQACNHHQHTPSADEFAHTGIPCQS